MSKLTKIFRQVRAFLKKNSEARRSALVVLAAIRPDLAGKVAELQEDVRELEAMAQALEELDGTLSSAAENLELLASDGQIEISYTPEQLRAQLLLGALFEQIREVLAVEHEEPALEEKRP